MNQTEIYSTSFTAGRRTYFFDIKNSADGDPYLTITESKKTENLDYDRYRIMIYGEDMYKFLSTLSEVAQNFPNPLAPVLKSDITVQGYKKSTQPVRAGMPWQPEDDETLEELYCEGASIKDLMIAFGRSRGAITSRIKKLELKEKYPNL
jgi:hypothetical protein